MSFEQEKFITNKLNTEKQVRYIIQKLFTAYKTSDAQLFEEITADEYIQINYIGESMTKDRFVSILRSGAIKFVSVTTSKLEIRYFSDMAIATYLAYTKFKVERHYIDGSFHCSEVILKRNDKWQIVHSHNCLASMPKFLFG